MKTWKLWTFSPVAFIGLMVILATFAACAPKEIVSDGSGNMATSIQENKNDPVPLAQRAFDLIMQLEGRDDRDPAVAEELRLLGETVNNLPETDQRIYYTELERLYIGEVISEESPSNVYDYEINFFAGYFHNAYIDILETKEIIHYGTGSEIVYFYCNVDLYEFKVLAVGTDEDFNFFAERTVLSLGIFSSDIALEYSTYIPDGIPVEAVSFKTADGTSYSYLLQLSGFDGSVVTTEWRTP